MKRLFAFFVLVISCGTSWATTTYTVTSPNYTSVSNFSPSSCTPTSCFTTTMHISGSFQTVSPLGISMPVTDISGSQLLSYNFSDGVTTYDSSDTTFVRLHSFAVATDATGAISSVQIQLSRWQSAASHDTPPTDRLDNFVLNTASGGIANHNVRCNSYVSATDLCQGVAAIALSSLATLPVPTMPPPSSSTIAPVPTVNDVGLMLLAAILALGGMLMVRRKIL